VVSLIPKLETVVHTLKCALITAPILGIGGADSALAQTYPVKLIRLISPSTPGGGTDIVARLIGQKLSESLGRPVVVENRPGAGGTLGTEAIARAAHDGYTIGMAQPGPMTIARSFFPLPYDPDRDFAPIILANESASVLVIHPSIPARSLKDLVALAKARPLNAAFASVGSVPHLLTELFSQAAQAHFNPIPYKGGALAVTDVVGGQVDALWGVLPIILPFTQNGKLRALAVASEKRSIFLPNIPTTAEAGWPGVVGTAWNGVVAPTHTPKEIIVRMNAEIRRALSSDDIRERYTTLGMESFEENTPESFGAFMHAETVKWSNVIKTAKIIPDSF
jgi:tripartite-type tricarboxylate transporter receptor subunit TctC